MIASLLMEKLFDRGYGDGNGGGFDLNAHGFLVVKLPDSRVVRIMSRSLFMVMVLMALPLIGSIMNRENSVSAVEESEFLNILPVLLRDLVDKGLIKKGHSGLVLAGAAATFEIDGDLKILRDVGIDLLTGEVNSVGKAVLDFVLCPSFHWTEMINGIVKDDSGLVISPLGNDPRNQLRNFEIVYLRKYQNTMVALRKKQGASATLSSSAKRVLCGVAPEKKKAALKELEDVHLEPPRQSKQPSFTSRKIKFLSNLLIDSLNEYPGRVLISDDSSAVDWYHENYPMENQEFQVTRWKSKPGPKC